MIILFLLVIGFIALITYAFMRQKKFGQIPTGSRLERIKQSENYKNGAFQNRSHTPNFTGDGTMLKVIYKFLFQKNPNGIPKNKIISVKPNLQELNPDEDCFIWFGHSSYYLQLEGKKILIDPVFSGSASPIKATTKSFTGSDIIKADDFKKIDYLIITHDHWDHLDYETIMQLKSKVSTVITGLGTGQHLEYWGYKPEIIIEKDWYEETILEDNFKITALPARHFTGRGTTRNKALWVSFLIETATQKIFIGGDGGYDSHFKEIGNRYGTIDLAFLECGQYNENWSNIHMMPNELLQAAKDLNVQKVVPVHWAKFSLAFHDWNEPIVTLTQLNAESAIELITPIIGEKVNWKTSQIFTKWWVNNTL